MNCESDFNWNTDTWLAPVVNEFKLYLQVFHVRIPCVLSLGILEEALPRTLLFLS